MPTNEEMAQEMDMTLEKYNKMIRITRNAISLERPKYKNNPKDLGHESEALVGDMVDSSAVIFDEKTPEQNVDHGLLHSDIQYMLGVSFSRINLLRIFVFCAKHHSFAPLQTETL